MILYTFKCGLFIILPALLDSLEHNHFSYCLFFVVHLAKKDLELVVLMIHYLLCNS